MTDKGCFLEGGLIIKVKVGLETVVSEIMGSIVKANDQAYLEPVVPEPLKGKMRFPDEIRRFRSNDAAEILAVKTAKKALDTAGLRPSDIDYIISNNCGGKYAIPMVGGYVHWKLEFPQETTVNLPPHDLDLVIFHQPADLLYDTWIYGAEKAGLSKDKWKHTCHKYGDLANAVVPVNLAEFWEKGELKKGMIMAWITIGAGGHAPTMIVRWLG